MPPIGGQAHSGGEGLSTFSRQRGSGRRSLLKQSQKGRWKGEALSLGRWMGGRERKGVIFDTPPLPGQQHLPPNIAIIFGTAVAVSLDPALPRHPSFHPLIVFAKGKQSLGDHGKTTHALVLGSEGTRDRINMAVDTRSP